MQSAHPLRYRFRKNLQYQRKSTNNPRKRLLPRLRRKNRKTNLRMKENWTSNIMEALQMITIRVISDRNPSKQPPQPTFSMQVTLPSQIMNMPNLTFLLKFPEFDVTPVGLE